MKHFYKILDGDSTANSLYEPIIDGNRFIMNWNKNSYYENKLMTDEHYDYWFKREMTYINKISDKDYAPEVVDVDEKNRKIIFKWYDKSLCRNLDIDGWKDKVISIKHDLEKSGIKKINLYPHTFYYDDEDNLRIFDMYGCTSNEDRYIKLNLIEPLIMDRERWNECIYENICDTHQLYDLTLKNNHGRWPESINA